MLKIMSVSNAIATAVTKIDKLKVAETPAPEETDESNPTLSNETSVADKDAAEAQSDSSNFKMGVGASVAVNTTLNTTRATISKDAKILNTNNIKMAAKSLYFSTTAATAGAAAANGTDTDVALDAAVAVLAAVNTTEAVVEKTDYTDQVDKELVARGNVRY